MIGAHCATVTPLAGGAPVEICCLVDQVSIIHGRDKTTGQPNASVATLDLSFDTRVTDIPPEVEIGAEIEVTTTLDGTVYSRFTGAISDDGRGWDAAGENTPNAAVIQILAAGSLSSDLRPNVGDVPWPQELDGARVARILAQAGVVLDPGTSDPGTVQILARDVDSQRALALAQDVAKDGSGILWQTRDGQIRYADAEHRRGAVPVLELGACDVLVTPTWRRNTDGLVTSVNISYGVAPEGGEQPQYVAENIAAGDRYGDHSLPPVSTQLAALADAQAMGNLLLSRNAMPVWLLEQLPVDVAGLDLARTAALLDLDMHDLLAVTGLPATGNLPTSTSLWVEGWTERLAYGVHDLLLYVSGYCRTVPPPRWNDVAPALTWDTVDPAMTWDSAACMGPMPSLGRWDDVPASTRWDTVPASVTWNTWKG